ncbi:UDP-N-acetylmuramate dehydrogenase [Ignavibacterium album JCM 16511]|uniref:UDP-N-acetylenolpyruvoylglucosamine reductase n=1 Tax=Ignavibacterium album (strain DSM 19864 / JCM 16511 / NBRC 101810 / Mat9-16) TaxID=945713 RepID=I0AJ87_IGNAJ|nr:UDP-N-acetylmuramate dehydrogenase [Ignavibacterium album]AFH49044.1 UDP-N-acetylmuramate dehydrogenase [Ignavibacterium album JCM 16511]
MKLFENFSLKDLNTFHIDVKAKRFILVEKIDELFDLKDSFDLPSEKILILGGGSNVLFTKDFDSTIIQLSFNQLSEINSDKNFVLLKAEAGMVWDDLVKSTVENNLGGIENLAMIPGTVGAAPIQNIGAYGQELKDTLYEVEFYDLTERKIKSFSNEQCQFGYRDSVFKKSLKNKFIITSITLRLYKNPVPVLNYGNVATELSKEGIANPTIKDVSNIIRKIRTEKLPDPQKIGNAGSFFKNPFVDEKTLLQIKNNFPDVPSFLQENKIKIPAAWLIEKSGLKGFRKGNVGTYPKQPLVIVNYEDATGAEIIDFAKFIQKTVLETFNIELEPEVNII